MQISGLRHANAAQVAALAAVAAGKQLGRTGGSVTDLQAVEFDDKDGGG